MEKNYKYLGYAMMLLIPLTFIGFYRTYFSLYPDFENLKSVHHFHGAVAGLWIRNLSCPTFPHSGEEDHVAQAVREGFVFSVSNAHSINGGNDKPSRSEL